MNVHAITDEALGNTAYLVEVGDGLAICVDPRRDVDEHLAVAGERGLRIVAVLETHLHADFVSGVREIAAATGAQIVAAAEAKLRSDHRGVHPGERIAFGDVEIEVIATPGHTPEHVAYLATSDGERALFSGGSLIVGGAARTDLTGAERTDELSRAQFSSVRRLASLPDETMLYATHGGGSFCSTGPARSAVSTIGDERRTNALFAIEDEDTFVEQLTRGFGTYPRYFSHLRDVNRAGATLLDDVPTVEELAPDRARALVERGAWLVDARSTEEWARAHATSSVSIELRPAFASWLGWVVPFGEPVVLVIEREHVEKAVRLARRIGYDRIEGWLRFESWRDAGYDVSSVPVLDAGEAAERNEDGHVVLDVRQRREFAERHIAGAVHLDLDAIIAGATPDARDVITYCGHGERSATAASLLARRGVGVANLRGGIGAWRAAGLPLEP